MEEADFRAAIESVKRSGVTVDVCNIFFPGIRMTGPEVDTGVITEYVKRALDRVARAGASMVVLGNGGLRAIPDGWPWADGVRQFTDVLRIIADGCEPYDITLLLEPLNKKETNLINTVAEGLALVRAVAHPRVKLLADYYHMRVESDAPASIVAAGDWIGHLHFANGVARGYPKDVAEDDYPPFVAACKAVGSARRISIEGRTDDFDTDAPAALCVMKELFS